MNRSKITIHILYATTILVAVFSILGYQVWSTKHAEFVKHEEQVAESKANKQAQESKEIAKEQRKKRVLACFGRAYDYYLAEWAKACKKQAKSDEEQGYKNCISNHYGSASLCKTLWDADADAYVDVNKSCDLPKYRADYLNKQREKYEQDCKDYA